MDIILKHALANALKYGRADFKAVVSKVFAESPDLKKDARGTVEKVKEVVERVNRMDPDSIRRKLEEIAPEMLEREKKDEKKELPPLEGAVEGKVKVRLPPEPNGYLHIGHALSFTLNYLYAQRYGGKVVLKLEDTNPLKEKPEYYAAIMRDIRWLGIEWDELFIISEHLSEVEKAAEELIRKKKAYVCTCPDEKIKEGRAKLEPDPCRNRSVQENLELWEDMKAGERFVLRWKGDPAANNAVLRDPTLYRVLDAVHPWTGENRVVYPTYDMASPFFDAKLGITHVLRSEEFLQRAELHSALIKALGMKPPAYVHYGRFELEGTPTSKRKIRPLVESGVVDGWDDPRLATIMALRRRGIVKETFRDLAIATGPYRGKSVIDWNLLLGLNRKHIDPVAPRYFVVKEPVRLKLDGPEKVAEVPFHPGNPKMGTRKVRAKETVFIEKEDYEKNLGRVVRLKDLYNVRIEKDRAVYVGDELIKPIIHWVSEGVEGELIEGGRLFNGEMLRANSLKRFKIVAELNLKRSASPLVQMERVGFARIEKKDPLRLVFVSG